MKLLLCCVSSLILLLISAPARAKEEVEQEDRIVNGSLVQPGQFKWVAALYFRPYDKATGKVVNEGNFFNYCGGAIVSQKFILTAAHCFFIQKDMNGSYWNKPVVASYEPSQVRVAVGITNRDSPTNMLVVKAIYPNPNYNNQSYSNDIALLELQQPLNESNLRSDSYQEIPIYRENIGEKEVKATVAGWGATCNGTVNQTFMRYIDVTTVPFINCNVDLLRDKSTANAICAGALNQNVGAGDSGGGLWTKADGKDRLIGLVSTILFCEGPKKPDRVNAIYTRVSHFRSWINQITGIN